MKQKSIREGGIHCSSANTLEASVQEQGVHLAIQQQCKIKNGVHYCQHSPFVDQSLIYYALSWYFCTIGHAIYYSSV